MKIRAISIGPVAWQQAQVRTRWRIVAIFRRALHLAAGDAMLCVVEAGLGNGPLNICVDADSFARVTARMAVGLEMVVADGAAGPAAEICIEVAAARRWQPDPVTPLPRVAEDVWQGAVATALRAAPPDSFMHAAFAPDRAASLLQRAAAARIADLCRWLAAPDVPRPVLPPPVLPSVLPPVLPLVGLGHGLTPAGDDFIGGLLLCADWQGAPQRVAALRAAVTELPPACTAPLSHNFLLAAAEGFAHEWLLALRPALQGADHARVSVALHRLAGLGHSSGWDAAAGLLAGLGAIHGWRAACPAARDDVAA